MDPPFEQTDEYARLAEALAVAHRKWPTGCYLLWYPIKDNSEVTAFVRTLARLQLAKTLRLELVLPNPMSDSGLRGSGLIAVNPPWKLHDQVALLLPALGRALSRGARCTTTVEWITRESSR